MNKEHFFEIDEIIIVIHEIYRLLIRTFFTYIVIINITITNRKLFD